jgi:hypothetical protein
MRRGHLHRPATPWSRLTLLLVLGVLATAVLVPAAQAAPARASADAPAGGELVLPWVDDPSVTVFLSEVQGFDLFDEFRIAVDDGAWSSWQPLTAEAVAELPSVDGAHVVHVQFASSGAGEPWTEQDPLSVDVPTTLDTVGPITVTLGDVTVTVDGSATVSFAVRDALSPRANARMAIRDSSGRTVRTVALGKVATGKRVTKRVAVHLPRGRYAFSVLAKDLAGNAQRRAGHGVLVVR